MEQNHYLYQPESERDSCGIGLVANIKGQQTHQLIEEAITVLKNLIHRGAVGGDSKTGDGAGILFQIPHNFFSSVCQELNIRLPAAGRYGVGMLFLPQDPRLRQKLIKMIENTVAEEGGHLLGFRDVPVVPECLGEMAKASQPCIKQVFVSFNTPAIEKRLYVLRKVIEKQAQAEGLSLEDFFIPSFSSRTIVYKGMFAATELAAFYPDLTNPQLASALAIVHQRYSTNTFPSWPLAQPFRLLAHNGEINTLRGNVNKFNARESTLASTVFGDDLPKLFPIILSGLSDSGQLDNVFELLTMGGRSLEHAIMMLVPEPFGSKYHISEDKRAFYEYHAAIMEPWDGPAALVFTDGERAGAILDRNGLRPIRYLITKSGKLVLASETGVLEVLPDDIFLKGRLAPGKMLVVDPKQGRVIFDNELKALICRQQPYRRWLEENRIELKGLFQAPGTVSFSEEAIRINQKIFGFTYEEINMMLAPMAISAQEPVGSMGNDAALAVLNPNPVLLHHYFKQSFAQVTNPPIDPYRENLNMSLMSFVGREQNLLDETPLHCHQLKLPHPILSNDDMHKLKNCQQEALQPAVIPIFFSKGEDLEVALERVMLKAEESIKHGSSLIILSDRGADEKNIPIPALLAVSAVHHHLIKQKRRQLAGLVIETGECRDVMQFSLLIGFGANAINPWLAFETIAELSKREILPKDLKLEKAFENYITAIKKGLLKVMSKMGISTIRSYRGAQLFEAIGIGTEVIAKYFPGTPSRIGGIDLKTIEQETLLRHQAAFTHSQKKDTPLPSGGDIHFRAHSLKHILTPEAIVLLQRAVRSGDYDLYKKYSKLIDNAAENLCTIRGLITFKPSNPVPLSEVEPATEIIKRFYTGAMSFGSISKEAHETIAQAMNALGAHSNSGEGGEEAERFTPQPGKPDLNSYVKQVASARFGVNSNYLVHAEELQIKIAQGAKPGEGGQLPGHKVDEIIARVRYATPGVMLISPPPHHDIYSIEDLAELIYDLRNANPQARISVKLVSELGVGTVAAGVAKAKADMVLISGHDGGTGAAPISSIKFAGLPWEIGLAETQQTLVLNKLRDKIRVQADGKLKTGRDVVIAALLGAEEYGFGTLALIALGCIMMRKCHLNTCPVGIATQDPELRKRFAGKPEHLINFMRFVAEETRELMAELGFRRMDEMIGRVDRLEVNRALGHWKTKGLDLSRILTPPPAGEKLFCSSYKGEHTPNNIDRELIADSQQALQEQKPVKLFTVIRNSQRAVGAGLAAEVSLRFGERGLPADTITCKFIGSAGQSFGAFLAPGITFELEGDANDYFGKGLSGGKLIIYPPRGSTFRPEQNIILGNVSLFGATGGEAYIHGRAGERFAVRNSGAMAVVEGVGDHACEYMTGGLVVVLGPTGVNFAAGMSGGIAYVLDLDQLFDTRCNLEMVDIEPLTAKEEQERLHHLIEKHVSYTGSEYAARILKDWNEFVMQFVRVMPIDYRHALERLAKQELKNAEAITVTEEVFR